MKKLTYFIKISAILSVIAILIVCIIMCQVGGPQGEAGEKGEMGNPGEKGDAGKSAYELAVENGYAGSVDEWLASLAVKGEPGDDGKSSFEIAVENGYMGTEEEWLTSLTGATGEKGESGNTPYIKDGTWWIGDEDTGVSANGNKGDKGDIGDVGEKGDKGDAGNTPYIKDGTWWIGDEDTGVSANGNKGDKGDKGDIGEKGDKGDKGNDGKNVVFRVNNNWLQWKYDTDTTWINLYEINSTPPSEGLVKLTYVLEGGAMPSGTPSEIEVTAGTVIQLPTPSYKGYTFDGWYISGESYPVSNTYRVHESQKLYAKWTPGATVAGKKIYTLNDLVNIKNDLGGTYVLMNDIDCNGLAIPTIGANASNPFRGLFDGQGYKIYNYTLPSNQYSGLFGYNSGTIRNLNVSNLNIEMNLSITEAVWVSAIVGYNTGTIEQCSVSNATMMVNINGKSNTGFIAGENAGNITNCFADGSLTTYSTSGAYPETLLGGICGYNQGHITNCYTNVSLRSDSGWSYYPKTAGITAVNASKGSIRGCLFIGTVESTGSTSASRKVVGDICQSNSGKISECYRDQNCVFLGTSTLFATAMTKANLSNSTFYSTTLGWDANVWNYSYVNLDNAVFPTLKVFN